YFALHAVGGTSISQWTPGSGAHYATLKGYIEAALLSSDLQSQGVTGLHLFCYNQGENQATLDTATFKTLLEGVIDGVYAEDFANPKMPFILSELAENGATSRQNPTIRSIRRL